MTKTESLMLKRKELKREGEVCQGLRAGEGWLHWSCLDASSVSVVHSGGAQDIAVVGPAACECHWFGLQDSWGRHTMWQEGWLAGMGFQDVGRQLASVRWPGSHPHPGPQGWRVQLGETLSMEKTGKSHFPWFKHPRSFAFRFLKFYVLGIYKFFECLHCSNMFQPVILKIAIPLHILSAAVIHDLHVSLS